VESAILFSGFAPLVILLLSSLQASHEHLISHILPMLVRAYDDTDPRLQEEVLRRTVPLSRQLDMKVNLGFLFDKLKINHLLCFCSPSKKNTFFVNRYLNYVLLMDRLSKLVLCILIMLYVCSLFFMRNTISYVFIHWFVLAAAETICAATCAWISFKNYSGCGMHI
jgi:hypothetical protein